MLKTVNVLRATPEVITNSAIKLNFNVMAVQTSRETKFPGSITYVFNDVLMRASLDINENIITTQVAILPSNSDSFIIDAILTDTFILVRWSNFRF